MLKLRLLFFALLLTAGTLGCYNLKSDGGSLAVARATTPTPAVERADCAETYGTAFRSQGERDWFRANCSNWPVYSAADNPPAPPVNQAQAQECDRLRGKPYESDEQRRWYLANCLGVNTPFASTGSETHGSVTTPQEGDRRSCDEIHGTPYRSSTERAWYLASCPEQGASNTATTSGQSPDRTGCDEIRGSAYRSDRERSWYLANCLTNTTTNTITSTTNVITPGQNTSGR